MLESLTTPLLGRHILLMTSASHANKQTEGNSKLLESYLSTEL